MKTHAIETSLRRHFEAVITIPEKHRDRVTIHWSGEAYDDNCLAIIIPRITSYGRKGPRDGDLELVTVQVTVVLKTDPAMELFGVLSLLVDEVRLALDSTRREEVGDPAAVAKVYNRENVADSVLDFGPAQETRSFSTSIQVGGVSLSGVDLAVLTSQAQTSPLDPRTVLRT